MEPENNIPDGESKVGDAKAGDREAVKLNHGTPEAAEPSVVASAAVESKPIQAETVQSKLVQTESVQPELVRPGMSERRFAQVSRRELLKVAPVLAVGGVCHSKLSGVAAQERAGVQRLGVGAAVPARPSGSDIRGSRADAVREVSHQRL